MNQPSVFESEIALPSEAITGREQQLLGFEPRYARVRDRLRLLFSLDELKSWQRKHHGGSLLIADFVAEQYPFIVFHGDVGTGKTATAEAIANRIVAESRAEDSVLFKVSNRVRGSGKVGEMGSLIVDAFQKVIQSAGKHRRAILLIDEGDSLGASRAQDHGHHEDRVAVNTLIQCIDDIRRLGGRVVVFLCTNRVSVLDPALLRRAAITEEFRRPNDEERNELLSMDLKDLHLTKAQIGTLVRATGGGQGEPPWTYSDIRTRLYPAALGAAFPNSPLTFRHLQEAAEAIRPSPVMEAL